MVNRYYDNSTLKQNYTQYLLKEVTYFRLRGEYLELICPFPEFDLYPVSFGILRILKNGSIDETFNGKQKIIMHLEPEDFGIYDCYAFIKFGPGAQLDLLYSHLHVEEEILSDDVFHAYPGSPFQINFPVVHFSPNDTPDERSTSYFINHVPLWDIDQGYMHGCSFASKLYFFSVL